MDADAALARRRAMADGTIWADSVVPERLWLGAGRDAANLPKLVEHGITHVLNCADDVPNFHEGEPGLAYLCLGVADFGADAAGEKANDAIASAAARCATVVDLSPNTMTAVSVSLNNRHFLPVSIWQKPSRGIQYL